MTEGIRRGRTLKSVTKRIEKLRLNGKLPAPNSERTTNRWSKEEDERISTALKLAGKKNAHTMASELAKVMENRPQETIRQQIFKLERDAKQSKNGKNKSPSKKPSKK